MWKCKPNKPSPPNFHLVMMFHHSSSNPKTAGKVKQETHRVRSASFKSLKKARKITPSENVNRTLSSIFSLQVKKKLGVVTCT